MMRKFPLTRLWRRLRQPVVVGPRRRRQAGIALIVVTLTVAVLGAVLGDFSFNARVDLEAAANARDSLRAEYLARSGIQLSRLLIKVQQSVLDKNRQFLGDVQISDFAPYLLKAFGGEADERAGLGALLGIDTSQLKGLGVGKGASFDVNMGTEDGRLNINCGGGINPVQAGPLYGVLMAMLWSPRYEQPPWRIFGTPDADGQVPLRDETTAAIIDWTDLDEMRYVYTPPPAPGQPATPPSGGGGAEDYRYDASRDPYRARNFFYDTTEEINLVRGVGEAFWSTFGEMLTVYGSCKVNIGAIPPDRWPLMAALIRYAADNPNDPILFDETRLAFLAQTVLSIAKLTGGFQTVDQLVQIIGDPSKLLNLGAAGGSSGSGGSSSGSSGQAGQLVGVKLNGGRAGQVMATGPRRLYRLDAVGTIQRTPQKKIQVHIRGIWDTQHSNQNPLGPDPNDNVGTWVYWRQD